MESWEEGWSRLLDEALKQLQRESDRIQAAWKSAMAGDGVQEEDVRTGKEGDSRDAGSSQRKRRQQPDFDARVYGEEPINRKQAEGFASAGRKTFDKTESRGNTKSRGNTAGGTSNAKSGNRGNTAKGGRASKKEKLPKKLEQLLDIMERESPRSFVSYSFVNNPLYNWNFYDESYHFCQQAEFMADYEDDQPYQGEIGQIFWPTYQKLNLPQLRGYFTWRKAARNVYGAWKSFEASQRGSIDGRELTYEKGSADGGGFPHAKVVTEAPLCYQYLYVYEIINQVGVDSPEDGYRRLEFLQAALYGRKSGIGLHLEEWMFDYVVYYGLDRSLLSETKRVKDDNALEVLLDMDIHTPDEVFEAAAQLSSYNVMKSKYVKEYPQQYREVLYDVLAQMISYYDKNRKNGFWYSLFGDSYRYNHEMFEGAVFYDKRLNSENEPQSIHYVLDDLCCFDYAKGTWRCDGYFNLGENLTLGQIMCAVDAEMRTQYGYEPAIRNTLEVKYLQAIVKRVVRQRLKDEEHRRKQEELAAKEAERLKKKQEEENRRKAEQLRLKEEEERRLEEERKKREVVLDFGKLDEIRRAAEITQQRLLVEDPEETQEKPEAAEEQGTVKKPETLEKKEPVEKPETVVMLKMQEAVGAKGLAEANAAQEQNGIGLNEAETIILNALLYGSDYKEYFRSHRLMPSLVVESLNEKLYDEIGDIVIEFDGDEPVLVEDYLDDIRKIFGI